MRTLLVIAIAMLMLPERLVTLRIPLEPGQAEEVVVVTFDEDRVSAADLKRWMLVHRNGRYTTPTHGYYPECKESDIPKLEDDVAKTQEILRNLNSGDYPQELSDVVTYLKNLQSFWLWQEEQELAFVKQGKLPDSVYNEIDLGSACKSSAQPQGCREVFTKWHNCVLEQMQKRLGHYPDDAWNAFLNAYGIRERVESSVD